MIRAIPPLLNTLSLCGAQLKKSTGTNLLLRFIGRIMVKFPYIPAILNLI
jgi:hypothetical protein